MDQRWIPEVVEMYMCLISKCCHHIPHHSELNDDRLYERLTGGRYCGHLLYEKQPLGEKISDKMRGYQKQLASLRNALTKGTLALSIGYYQGCIPISIHEFLVVTVSMVAYYPIQLLSHSNHSMAPLFDMMVIKRQSSSKKNRYLRKKTSYEIHERLFSIDGFRV